MSQETDDKIKQLFTEADRAKPEPPAMPALERPAINWWRLAVAPAAAVLILFVGTVSILNALGVDLGLGIAADSGVEGPAPDHLGFVIALADLNTACDDFTTDLPEASNVTDDSSALGFLESLRPRLPVLVTEVERVAARFAGNEELAGVATQLKGLEREVSAAVTAGNATGALVVYRTIVANLADIADELVGIGALGCSDLG